MTSYIFVIPTELKSTPILSINLSDFDEIDQLWSTFACDEIC
jgi:hypothetical protein